MFNRQKKSYTSGVLPMKETYTYEDALVQFLYHEMPAEEAADMALALEVDEALHTAFRELREAKTQLPKVQFNPSSTALNNILQYSTKTTMEAQL
jgi:hypothetical protein